MTGELFPLSEFVLFECRFSINTIIHKTNLIRLNIAIRAFAFGIMACSGRLGAICSNLLNGILFQGASVASILFVTGVSMFSGAFAAAYTKEMTGVELSDR